MRLNQIKSRGWRNLEPIEFRPGPRATVISGDNGQGKTNLVEAVYYLLAFRSFRTTSSEELWAWNTGGAKLRAQIEGNGLNRIIEADLGPERKTFRLDGKPVRRDSESLAPFGMVLFVPEDLLLPRSSPAARRKFIDLAIFGQDRGYYREASIYQKLVKSRNSVLKRGGDTTLLDSYDLQLARAGARLVTRRRNVCEQLLPLFRELYASIHEDLDATLVYRGHETLRGVEGEPDLAQALEAGLRERRELDLRRGFTGYGPHGDDVDFCLKGHLAKEHGSQGQLRSLVLALKLAELSLLEQTLGEAPLLLLDDVASELDAQRRRRLFETIADLRGQTLITVTDPEFLPQLPSRTDFRMESGNLV